MSEHKKVSRKVEDGKLKFAVDTNQDGEPVLEVVVALAEIPDEVIDGIKSARSKKDEE